MPGNTTNLQLRYPVQSDPPDGSGAFYNLAADVEQMLRIGGAEWCANQAAIAAIPTARCFTGKLAYAADTDTIWRYTGGWSIWAGQAAFSYGAGWADFGTPWTSFARREGRQAVLQLAWKNTAGSLPAGGQTNINPGTIPAGFRPYGAVVHVCSVYTGGWSGVTAHVQLNPAGDVSINWTSAAVPTNSLIGGVISFPAA